jgi:hypothetical protein
MAKGDLPRHELLSQFEHTTMDLQHMCRQIDVELTRRSGWGLTGAPAVLLIRMEEMADLIGEWRTLASKLSVREAAEAPGVAAGMESTR